MSAAINPQTAINVRFFIFRRLTWDKRLGEFRLEQWWCREGSEGDDSSYFRKNAKSLDITVQFLGSREIKHAGPTPKGQDVSRQNLADDFAVDVGEASVDAPGAVG
jgi:hypothetical protein